MLTMCKVSVDYNCVLRQEKKKRQFLGTYQNSTSHSVSRYTVSNIDLKYENIFKRLSKTSNDSVSID